MSLGDRLISSIIQSIFVKDINSSCLKYDHRQGSAPDVYPLWKSRILSSSVARFPAAAAGPITFTWPNTLWFSTFLSLFDPSLLYTPSPILPLKSSLHEWSRVQNFLCCQSSLLFLLKAMSGWFTFDALLGASHIALRKLRESCCLKSWFYLELLL